MVVCTVVDKLTGHIQRHTVFNSPMADSYDETPTKVYTRVNTVVACGQCLECLQQRSIEWSHRIMDEVSLHNSCCFLTLTYKDNPVNLVKRDLQLFVKRLRKALEPQKIRYFACGEYGAKRARPHYHMIIFGWRPDDLEYFFTDAHGFAVYQSPFVAERWSLGYVTVGDVTLETAKYCAKYLQKLQDTDGLEPPFLLMSTRPGIGYGVIDESMLVDDKIYHEGNYIKLPRYYCKVLASRCPDKLAVLKEQRVRKAKLLERTHTELQARREELQARLGAIRCPSRRKKSKMKK
ncbi:replication initiation protein [Tortoise microvirus 111]|nr:replication initiation protein [Tortoise microvirus 9]QCS37507.1 replication initiation protein [Tortoise microvirus 111]QPB07336.1 MAG: replication initiator protein [Microvirus sp.]